MYDPLLDVPHVTVKVNLLAFNGWGEIPMPLIRMDPGDKLADESALGLSCCMARNVVKIIIDRLPPITHERGRIFIFLLWRN